MSKASRILAFQCGVFAIVFGLMLRAEAQSEGNNAISKDTSGTIAASTAYIDASPFFTSGGDICQTINGILTSASYPTSYPNGAVIDARAGGPGF